MTTLHQYIVKQKWRIGIILLLSCVMILGMMVVVSTAEASDQKAQTEKLIQDWEKRYGSAEVWKVVEPTKDHITKMKALRVAVEAIFKSYDLSPSNLQPYNPRFSFLVDKNGNPYWQIYFYIDPKVHKALKPITVQINAVSGKAFFVSMGSDG